MKILVTGAAGFVGFHTIKGLLKNGHTIVGLDNINDYYDVSLKYGRLDQLGIVKEQAKIAHKINISKKYGKALSFIRLSLEDRNTLSDLFGRERFDIVCHLAAQAGVRYSLKNPQAYIDSNIQGFFNILECCRAQGIKHLIYASSSSVYGINSKIPFEIEDKTDCPISLYAATKKSNELMAHTYTHLYGFATTGLRFFTVYGPWGRPDMALFLFTDAIVKGNTIKVFNNGNMERDFTYIDDIVEGLIRIVEEKIDSRLEKPNLFKIYNIGNNRSVKLMEFISTLEQSLGIEAKMEMLPIQPGDVDRTWANVDSLIKDYGYRPNTSIEEGVRKFVEWYRSYYGV